MKRLLLVFSALLGSAACNGNGSGDGGHDGGLLDICNDAGSALADKACELNITILDGGPGGDGGAVCQQYYIDHVKKQLWLWFDVPQSVAPQSLLQIIAGYTVASTPVQLQINVLDGDQIHSLATGVANATGSPKPIQLVLIIPDGGAGAQYFVEASDASNLHDDPRNPFEICASLFPDPDRNVPGVPTPVTLSGPGGNGLQTGSCLGGPCTGVLTVEGRVDLFSVAIPAGITRPILYVNLTAPTTSLAPPVAYLGKFQILDPTGKVVYQDNVANVDLALDLSTAQLVQPGVTYTIQVLGLPPTGSGSGVEGPGDPRLTYTLTANVMPDEDVNEPDDNPAQAHAVQFTSLPSSQTVTGRLAYVGDQDWYAIQIPPTTGHASRLHYKITPTTNGGRYPPILDTVGGTLPNPDRAIELTNLIAGEAACLQDKLQCPEDPLTAPAGSNLDLLHASLCSGGTNGDGGALCLLGFREAGKSELAGFKDLQNFEGIIAIPPTLAQGATFYLDYQSYSGTYCDDLDYTLTLDWEKEGPENDTGYHSTIATAIPYGTLTDPGTFPNPPAGMSGVITTGYGYLQNPDYDMLDLALETPPYDVRGPSDYDAVPSTADTYEVDFPASYVSTPGYGATWELSWDLSGSPAEDLLIQVQFCTVVGGILSCDATGPSGPSGLAGAFGYTPGDYDPWWRMVDGNYVTAYIPPIFGLNGNTVLAEPSGCFCFNPAFLAAGKFYVTVLGADRTGWTDTGYTLNMGITTYPQSFTLDGGPNPNPISCPYTPVYSDGGVGDAGTKIPACEFVQGF